MSAAGAPAGGAPVGSHHLLEAMRRAENGVASRVLHVHGLDAVVYEREPSRGARDQASPIFG
jgi:hypothetical protein